MRAFLTACGLFLLAPAASGAAPPTPLSRTAWQAGRLELGPHLSLMSLQDDQSGEVLRMGGVGGQLRYRLSRRWGVEGGLDLLGAAELAVPGREEEVQRISVPVRAAALFYLFPDARLQLYGLLGFGVVGNVLAFRALQEEVRFAMPLGQAGVGLQLRLQSVRLDATLRAFHMERIGAKMERGPLDPELAGGPPSYDYQPYLGDRALSGAMLSLGVSWGL